MIFDEETREKTKKRIKNILVGALNKNVYTTSDECDTLSDKVVYENRLVYDVDNFADVLVNLIEKFGKKLVWRRNIFPNEQGFFLNSMRGIFSLNPVNNNSECIFFLYPEVVANFLNDIELLDKSSKFIDNNSLLVGLPTDDNSSFNDIYFENLLNIDLSDMESYYMLKEIVDCLKLEYVKESNYKQKYDDKIESNNIIFNYVKKIDNVDVIKALMPSNKRRIKVHE